MLINIQFEHYNHFQNRNWKTKQQIKEQIYTDLMAYKISKMAYKQKYGKFDYPDYPPIDKIIDIVIQWKERANDPEEKQLSQEILDLILDENTKPISYYQSRIEKTGLTSSHVDATEQFQLANKIHDKIDKRNEEIKEKLQENPDAKFGLEIDEDEPNKDFSQLPKLTNNQNNILSKEQKNIISKMNILMKSAKNLYKNKCTESEVKKNLSEAEKLLSDYYKKNSTIDFVYKHIHKDKALSDLSNYIKQCKPKEKKLYKFIQNLLTKFEYL